MLISRARHIVLILSIISELISSISINSFTEHDLQAAVCIHNSFDCRNRSVSKPPEGYMSCCQQCVCSEDCVEGNCCSNSAINPSMKAPCRNQTNLFGKHPYLSITIQKLQFYTVDTCPENSNAALKSACEDPRDIQDFNLVSDAKNNNIFKNEKCALCNGITSIKRWSQGFVLGVATNTTEVLRLVKGNKPRQLSQLVQIYSYPPEDFPAHMYSCNVNAINKCNVSGLWDDYDETIVSLCENPSLMSNYPSSTKVYKNIYCERCNTKKSHPLSVICIGSDSNNMFMYKELRLYRMTMLLESDWYREENNLIDVSRTHCAMGEVPDPWTGECIVLKCPVGTSPYFGRCQENKYTTDGFAVAIVLQLTIDNSSRTEWLNSKMIKRFVESISAIKYGCRLCAWYFWSSANVTINRYYVDITICTRNRCNESDIISMYYKLLYGEKKSSSMQYSTLEPTLIEREYFEQLENLTMLFLKRSIRCPQNITLKGTFYCPSVTFNITTLDQYFLPPELQKDLIGISELLQWPKGNNQVYSVCLSDFRKVKKTYLESAVTSEKAFYFRLACTSILSCMAIIASAINFYNPEVPRALKLVITFLCVVVVFESIFNGVMLNVIVAHKITILILRNVMGSFCSLLVSFVNVGIMFATLKINDSQDDLVSFGSRVRTGVLLSLCMALVLSSCEGLYLLICYNKGMSVNRNKCILAHCVTCFLPLGVAIFLSLTLIYKQLKTNRKDANQSVMETISFSRGLFFASMFSVIVEIVRTINDFIQSPEFPLISSALSIPYSVVILVCFTFRVPKLNMRCILGIWNSLTSSLCKNRT